MTAWQQAIRSLDAIGLSDKKRVISTLRVVSPIAGGRLFLAIYKKIVRLQSWRYLLRVAKSGAKGDGFISLTVDIVRVLPIRTQNTPDNVTVLYFFTCFGRRWYFDRRQFPVAIIGGCKYKVALFAYEVVLTAFSEPFGSTGVQARIPLYYA